MCVLSLPICYTEFVFLFYIKMYNLYDVNLHKGLNNNVFSMLCFHP